MKLPKLDLHTLSDMFGLSISSKKVPPNNTSQTQVSTDQVASQTPVAQPPLPPIEEQRPAESERKVLYDWEADSRPVKQPLNPRAIKTLVAIGVVVSLLLIVLREYIMLLGFLGIGFLYYALTKAVPDKVNFKLTNQGVSYDAQFYYWDEFYQFYIFTAESNERVLALDMRKNLPGRLFVTLAGSGVTEEELRTMLKNTANLHEIIKPPEDFMDRSYKSFVGKLNI